MVVKLLVLLLLTAPALAGDYVPIQKRPFVMMPRAQQQQLDDITAQLKALTEKLQARDRQEHAAAIGTTQ